MVRKTDTIKRELGSLAEVIEGLLAETLRLGIRHDQVEELEQKIESADLEAEAKRTVEEELETARQRQDELRGEIDRLRNRVAKSKKWIGLEEAPFRSAISCALARGPRGKASRLPPGMLAGTAKRPGSVRQEPSA